VYRAAVWNVLVLKESGNEKKKGGVWRAVRWERRKVHLLGKGADTGG